MKLLLYTIIFTLSLNLSAQPGDIIGWRINRVKEINGLLKIDTNNHQLLWERLEIVFNPHFNLYTQTRKPISKSDFMLIGDDHRLRNTYKNVDVLADINYLIEHTTTIKKGFNQWKKITTADFIYKKGQYYYLNGQPEQALENYLIALQKNPDSYLLNRISISIAAYYYTLDTTFNLENLEKALEYIDIAIPKEIENTPETFERFTDKNHHPFERNKIMLLELTNKNERLKKYLKSLAKSHLRLYNKEIKKSDDYKKGHSHSIPSTLDKGLNYLFKVAENYYKVEEYEKSKRILELIIGSIPDNRKKYSYYDTYYYLLAKIYTKKCYKNTNLEIDNLINTIGSPSHHLRGVALNQLKTKLNQLIINNPNKPKLFLGKSFLIYKESINSKMVDKKEIFNLLDTSQNLGLVDYRIPYLKGLIFTQYLEYDKAIVEFDKSIAISDRNLNVYWEKLKILRKIPNYDNEKIEAIKAKLKKIQQPDFNDTTELINQIDEL